MNLLLYLYFFTRESSIAIVHISYDNSVHSSVTTWYSFKPRLDREFGFSLYDSLKFLVFCDKILYHWVRRVPMNEGAKEGHPLKRHYFTAIG